MKTVKRVVIFVIIIIVIWNILVVMSSFVLDKIDPYYAVQQANYELTKDELITVCPDALLSESDKELLLSVLNDPVVLDELPIEYGDILWLSKEDCSRIISKYKNAPTDICRICVSQSSLDMYESTTYVGIEFYETEEDKGSTPSTAYPCLYLNLQATKLTNSNTEGSSDSPFIYSYRKEIFRYSLKVADNRIGTSSWGGPDATYHRYACDTAPYGTTFDHQEKILTPMKHRHLYLKYFGWFEAMMSV